MAPLENWGTIRKCRFPLGYQRMTDFELQQSVQRLTVHRPTKQRPWWEKDFKHKRASEKAIEKTVTRLTNGAAENATDAQRVAKGRIKVMGVVNSFAWKGYN
ncbi:uncharacterized protein LOC104265630 [Ciona intestinalis]